MPEHLLASIPDTLLKVGLGALLDRLLPAIWRRYTRSPKLTIRLDKASAANGDHPALILHLSNRAKSPCYVEQIWAAIKPRSILSQRWLRLSLPKRGEGWLPRYHGQSLSKLSRPFREPHIPIEPQQSAIAAYALSALRAELPKEVLGLPEIHLRVEVKLQNGQSLHSNTLVTSPETWPIRYPIHSAIL